MQPRQRHEEDDDCCEDNCAGERDLAASRPHTSFGAELDGFGGLKGLCMPRRVPCGLFEQVVYSVRSLVHLLHFRAISRVSDSIWDASVVRARWIQERTVPAGAFISRATSSTLRSKTTWRTKARR